MILRKWTTNNKFTRDFFASGSLSSPDPVDVKPILYMKRALNSNDLFNGWTYIVPLFRMTVLT